MAGRIDFKLQLFLVLSVLTANGLFAQKLIKKGDDFYITPQNDSVFMESYVIKNDSKDSVWMWFDPHKSKSLSDNIDRYFYTTKGDVSLLDILNDESVYNKRLNITEQSFVKLILPNSQFGICLIKGRLSDSVDTLDHTMVLVKSSQLSRSLKSSLIRNVEYMYNLEMIVIDRRKARASTENMQNAKGN